MDITIFATNRTEPEINKIDAKIELTSSIFNKAPINNIVTAKIEAKALVILDFI
jgi:hypothetical protein